MTQQQKWLKEMFNILLEKEKENKKWLDVRTVGAQHNLKLSTANIIFGKAKYQLLSLTNVDVAGCSQQEKFSKERMKR